MLAKMMISAARILLGFALFVGAWAGGILVGKVLFPDSDAVIVTAVLGCFVGVQLCMMAWTNSWR